jgi:Ca-activated chloride channel family protein
MENIVGNFHFLRPLWLLLALVGLLLPWLWKLQSDPQRAWEKIIAPALLTHLIVGAGARWRLRPVHEIACILILAGIAVAGPTWQREPPPFTQDKAPLIVALDLSHSMNATDIAPTRLERAKQKIRDLMQLRAGARTGLIVYAGSAHLVVPPADDPAVMNLFLPALTTDLMPRAGRNSGAALKLADALLKKEVAQGGTVLFIADDVDTAQIDAFTAESETPRQILWLTVGTAAGGPLRDAQGDIEFDAIGQPLRAGFDRSHFEKLADEADIPLASVTLDDDDVQWVQRRAQTHLQQVQAARTDTRWKEFGYYLCIPVALLAALWFRRGWVVQWSPIFSFMMCMCFLNVCAPNFSYAYDLHPIDWFATKDQQGRWYFEHGDIKTAAQRFDDPLWKGFALYRTGDYVNALAEFARLADDPKKSAQAYFMMGNCQARLHNYPNALAAYDNALKRRPKFPQAAANRALMEKLLEEPPDEDDDAESPRIKPDDVKFDNDKNKGKEVKVNAQMLRKQTADMWMRNLNISPAEFLRTKFSIQDAEER